jgi:hypothetical protein
VKTSYAVLRIIYGRKATLDKPAHHRHEEVNQRRTSGNKKGMIVPEAKEIYEGLVKKGWTEKDAAKYAQQKTGIALVTGQPIRQKQLKFGKRKGAQYGQSESLDKFKGGNLNKFRPYG